jgi:hypothetical protein
MYFKWNLRVVEGCVCWSWLWIQNRSSGPNLSGKRNRNIPQHFLGDCAMQFSVTRALTEEMLRALMHPVLYFVQ